jgi:hypothetical protein
MLYIVVKSSRTVNIKVLKHYILIHVSKIPYVKRAEEQKILKFFDSGLDKMKNLWYNICRK